MSGRRWDGNAVGLICNRVRCLSSASGYTCLSENIPVSSEENDDLRSESGAGRKEIHSSTEQGSSS